MGIVGIAGWSSIAGTAGISTDGTVNLHFLAWVVNLVSKASIDSSSC